MGTATKEKIMAVPQIIKNGIASWLSNSTAGYISKETQNANSKYIYTHFYSLQCYLH